MKSSVKLIIRFTLLFWLLEKAVSWRLWLAERSFPLVPVVPYDPAIHIALFILFFVLVVLLYIKPHNRLLLYSLLITEAFTLLGDELRWQPWEYQFFFILLAVLINFKNEKRAINSVFFILAATYFFNGLQKLNPDFLSVIWTNMVLVSFLHLPLSVISNAFIQYAGFLIPAIEILCSFGLLFTRYNKQVARFLIGIHVFILLFLGPLGINTNIIVWPWNIAMIFFLYFVFIRNNTIAFYPPRIIYKWNWVITIACGLLPMAGLFGFWDANFSGDFYSGKEKYTRIFINNKSLVPSELQPYVQNEGAVYNGSNRSILISGWSLDELKILVPPQQRILRSIEQSFKLKYPQLQPVFIHQ